MCIRDSNGTVLFVGTKKQAQEAVSNQATRVNMPYVSERWLGGMLTNFQTVSKRVSRLKELEEMDFTDVRGSGLTKKELLLLEREKDKLAKQLGGILSLIHISMQPSTRRSSSRATPCSASHSTMADT